MDAVRLGDVAGDERCEMRRNMSHGRPAQEANGRAAGGGSDAHEEEATATSARLGMRSGRMRPSCMPSGESGGRKTFVGDGYARRVLGGWTDHAEEHRR